MLHLIKSYGLNFSLVEGNPQEFLESEAVLELLETGSNPFKFIRLFSEAIAPEIVSLMSDVWQLCQNTDVIIAHSLLF